MAFVLGAIGSAIYAGMASQPVATAIAAPIVMWLIKKRYVKSIQNPVARTIVGVVDSTALGAPIVLVVASVDLVVTGVTGVVKSFVAGGYVLKIQSKPAHALTSSILSPEIARRETLQHENSLDKSWELLDNIKDEEFEGFELIPANSTVNMNINNNNNNDNVNNNDNEDDDDDDDDFSDLRGRWLLSDDQVNLFASALENDPDASVLIVPVHAMNENETLDKKQQENTSSNDDEIELSTDDAIKVLKLMSTSFNNQNENNDNETNPKDSSPLSNSCLKTNSKTHQTPKLDVLSKSTLF
mmetsp:Transcript_933/g.1515  ORF Transcript_933/g.1515 Transcript_933/m.1515 type:complete len:299 (+) Transcript_933:55-951(+)